MTDVSNRDTSVDDELAGLRHQAGVDGVAIFSVMASKRFTIEDAFLHLKQRSQHEHRKLREIAEDILVSGLPDAG